jgi:aminopeptidase N
LPVRDVEQAGSIFDAITYPKGASVLKQLMTYVGEDTFAAGMTAYFAKHQWGNTTLQDLMDSLAVASGRDLDAWRAAWLETAGTDRLTLERDGERAVLVARAPSGATRPHVLDVGVYLRAGERLQRSAVVRVEARGERTSVDLPPAADLYLVNDDDLTFASTRPDPDRRAALIDAAAALPTAISRGVAVGTVWDMLITGEATAAEVVRCLTGVLAVETSASTIEPYLNRACDAAELWSPDSERDRLLADVAATCRLLAEQPSRRQPALRAFARAAGTLEDLAWLQDAAGDDVDLRWRALIRKAELGGATDDEAADLRRRDPNPDAWLRIVAVRAAARDAARKEEVWTATVIDKKVPISELGEVMTAFWRPGQDDVLASFTSRYLEVLPELDRGGKIQGMVYTRRLFPVFVIDEEYLQRAEQAAQGVAPAVSKYVLERADEVRRMLRARHRGSVTGG